jgi:hypothetical protein
MQQIEAPIAASTQVELDHGNTGAGSFLHDRQAVLNLRGREPSAMSAHDRLLLRLWRGRLLPVEGGGSGPEQKRSKGKHLVSINVPLHQARNHAR